MKRAFADTYFYIALLSPSDLSHQTATEFTQSFRGSIVTTEWVLTEVADGLCGTPSRSFVIHFVNALRRDPAVQIVPISGMILERAWEVYERYTDKEWSLTDCTSFIIMRDLRLTDVLTADRHFEQAGFHKIF
jgi:uncharacterized protein